MGYRLNRYSEDLDFNYYSDQQTGMQTLKETTKKLWDFGVEGTFRITYESSKGFQGKIRYNGLLFNGKEVSKGTIKIDVSCRNEQIDTTTKLYKPMYDDCPMIPMLCLTLDHLIAEKIRALIIRGKPRDLYDIWFFHEQITINLALINQKLNLYSKTFETIDIKNILASIQSEWKQDMMPLLGILPDFEHIQKDIAQFLKKIQQS